MGGSLDPAGPVARAILDLWWILLAVGVVAFLAFAVVLGYGLARPQGSVDDAPADGDRRMGRRLLLLGGVVLPVAGILVAFGFTARTMHVLDDDAPKGVLVVEVVGHQWWWEVRYPRRGVVLRDELRIPTGETVELRLTSADVIHSFWVPSLAGKLDLLPDGTNTLLLQADLPGRYSGQCAEFCGLRHSDMRLVVLAEPRAAFDAWLDGAAR